MAQDEGSGAGTVMLAFLLGAAAGAAVALLFAPATGKEAREFLGQKAREGRTKAAEVAQQAREVIDKQREALSSAVERGRKAYRDLRGEETA